MGSHGGDLLRMLEPAVRPAGLPAVARSARPPFEQQDFATMLSQAQQTTQMQQLAQTQPGSPAPGSMQASEGGRQPSMSGSEDQAASSSGAAHRSTVQLNQVENASLAQWLMTRPGSDVASTSRSE